MALAICFRYGGREYYKELGVGDELSFGSHKKDKVQIPDSKDHMLWMKANADDLQVKTNAPLRVPLSVVECNEMTVLNNEMDSLLYVSRVVGRSSKSINLPYNGRITVGRSGDNDIRVTYPVGSVNYFV